jgi:1-phosphofructokinase
MDADGALFLGEGRIVLAMPPLVAMRTKVDAGEALLAGIVSARLRRLALPELARLASGFVLESVTGRAAAEWLGDVVVESLA